jgi:succinyl-CoA:acetate CoA-transferase
VTDPATAADRIADDATVLVSGFGSVGYPKAVPLALADSGRDLSLTVVSGGSVGEEIDVALVEADGIGRRYPYRATSEMRTAINDGKVAFSDRSVSALGDEVNHAQPLVLAAVHDVYRQDPPPDREPIPLTDPVGRIGSPRIEFDPAKLEAVVESDRAIAANFGPSCARNSTGARSSTNGCTSSSAWGAWGTR